MVRRLFRFCHVTSLPPFAYTTLCATRMRHRALDSVDTRYGRVW